MAKKKQAADQPTFEQSLQQLEEVVGALEGGELGLDEALEQYERGVASLKRCHAQLAAAERRIELLSGVDAEGRPTTEPMGDDEATSLDEPAAKRSTRRSRKAAGPGGSTGVDDLPGLF